MVFKGKLAAIDATIRTKKEITKINRVAVKKTGID